MNDDIIRIKSITQMHDMLGYEKPTHPLVTVIDLSKVSLPTGYVGQKFAGDYYCVSIKDHDCGMQYGRNHYDFEEGVLIFYGPNQVVAPTEEVSPEQGEGWMLFFHPDLIRKTALGKKIHEYSFFSYDVHEALHLSQKERDILGDCVDKIKNEYEQNIDAHSQDLIVSNIELLLNYSKRFYERQFHTRTDKHQDIVSQFEHLLNDYFESDRLAEEGAPAVAYFADNLHLSGNYLGDLLKKETGRGVKDHVNEAIIDRAKTLLLSTNNTVSEIAYKLGFNYPHYFSRMFKLQTGMTPHKYRMVS